MGRRWVGDVVEYCDNIYPGMKDIMQQACKADGDIDGAARRALAESGVRVVNYDDGAIRHYDPQTHVLSISTKSTHATQRFQLLLQVALIKQDKLLNTYYRE